MTATWELIEGWRARLAAGGARPGTIKIRVHHVDRFARVHPRPGRVRPGHLEAWLANPNWAPETRKSARTSLRGFFRWAHQAGHLPTDPTADLPVVRVPAGVPRPVPEAVLDRALCLADDQTRLMLLLGSRAGLRRAEIAAVHTDDVTDLGLMVTGKGGKQRLVPLAPALRAELAELPRGWAFPSPVRPGRHVSVDYVSKRLAAVLPDGWTPHSLRHRFATRAYSGTRDIRAVQLLLGHARSETTERYTAIVTDDLAAAALAAA